MSLVKTWYLVFAGRRLNEIQPVSLPNDKLIKLRNNFSIPDASAQRVVCKDIYHPKTTI